MLVASGALAQSPPRIQDIPEVYPQGLFRVTYTDPSRSLTIDPTGMGETLAEVGITIQVQVVRTFLGGPLYPMPNVPPSELILFDSDLCFCAPFQAARPTDANGDTEFTGTIRGGGCVESLDLYVDGVWSGQIPIRVNSVDTGNCSVDASDLVHLARRLGRPELYDFCFDYNDSGGIDAGDLAFFASHLGTRCSAP